MQKLVALLLVAGVANAGVVPVSNVVVGATATQYHAQDELGQYAYGYAGGPSAKEEIKTADGITRGGYDYIDAHGIVQSARYVSDPVNGFRVAATNLPVGPAVPDGPEEGVAVAVEVAPAVAAVPAVAAAPIIDAPVVVAAPAPVYAAPEVVAAPAPVQSSVVSAPIIEQISDDDSVSIESAIEDSAAIANARARLAAIEESNIRNAIQEQAYAAELSRPVAHAIPAAVRTAPVAVATHAIHAAPVAAIRTAPVAAVHSAPVPIAAVRTAAVHATPVAVAAPAIHAAPVAVAHAAPVAVAHAAPVAVAHAPVVVGATATQYHAQDELGQYAYGYAGGPSAKEELKTADGITQGGYDYIDAHGIVQSARYVSDDVHGFRVAATNLPVQPAPAYIPDAPDVAEAKARLFQAQAEHIAKL